MKAMAIYGPLLSLMASLPGHDHLRWCEAEMAVATALLAMAQPMTLAVAQGISQGSAHSNKNCCR